MKRSGLTFYCETIIFYPLTFSLSPVFCVDGHPDDCGWTTGAGWEHSQYSCPGKVGEYWSCGLLLPWKDKNKEAVYLAIF